MTTDENDKLKAGTLSHDPEEGTERVRKGSAFATVVPFDAASVLDEKLPERRYLLRDGDEPDSPGVLPGGRVGILVAGGGVGKTWALVQLGISVATGGLWLGRFRASEKGHALLVLAEEEAVEAKRRLHTAVRRLNLSTDRASLRRLHILALAGHDVTLTRMSERGELETTQAHGDLLRLLNEHTDPWSLVVIDPLSRFAAADAETDNAAATRFIQSVEQLSHAKGEPTVLVAHHSSKAARDSGKQTDTASRGASAITDGARWAASLTRRDPVIENAPRLVDFTITKTNYGRPAHVTLVQRDQWEGFLDGAGPEEEAEYRAAKDARSKAEKEAKDAASREARRTNEPKTNGKHSKSEPDDHDLEDVG